MAGGKVWYGQNYFPGKTILADVEFEEGALGLSEELDIFLDANQMWSTEWSPRYGTSAGSGVAGKTHWRLNGTSSADQDLFVYPGSALQIGDVLTGYTAQGKFHNSNGASTADLQLTLNDLVLDGGPSSSTGEPDISQINQGGDHAFSGSSEIQFETISALQATGLELTINDRTSYHWVFQGNTNGVNAQLDVTGLVLHVTRALTS